MEEFAKKMKLSYVSIMHTEFKRYQSLKNLIKVFDKQLKRHGIFECERIRYRVKMWKRMIEIWDRRMGEGYINKKRVECLCSYVKRIRKRKTEEIWNDMGENEWLYSGKNEDGVLGAMMDKIKGIKVQSMKNQLRWRIEQELMIYTAMGWFPVFNTLTVAGEYMGSVFEKGSKAFLEYRKAGDEIAGGEDFHRFFAVVEEGGKTGRLHIHTVELFKSLPGYMKKDPNRAVEIPINRLVPGMMKLWKYGFSAPIAIRTTNNDVWGRLGWRWPCKKMEDGSYPSIKSSKIQQMSSYMSKYLNKSYMKKGGTRWRTRMNSHYGLKVITETMQKVDDAVLISATELRTSRELKIGYQGIPRELVIKEANREMLRRIKRLPMSQQMKILQGVVRADSIIERYRKANQRNSTKLDSKSITCTGTENTKNMDTFENILLLQNCLTQVASLYYNVIQVGYVPVAGSPLIRN